MKQHASGASVSEVLQNFDLLPDCAQVRLPVVKCLCGVSATTIWRRVSAGTLPPPLRINPRCSVWRVGDLRRHLQGGGA